MSDQPPPRVTDEEHLRIQREIAKQRAAQKRPQQMSPEREQGAYKMLAALVAGLLLVLGLNAASSSSRDSSADANSRGYAAGMADGQRMRETQTYSNDQIDSIVDPVVKSRRADIVSKEGSDYAEGWVSGLKEGMRK